MSKWNGQKWWFNIGFLIAFIGMYGNSDSTQLQLEEIIQKRGIPGISLSVIQDGKQQNFVAGYADVEAKVPMELKHRMFLGSVGKTFFAALTLKLQEEKVINIDEKVSTYLREENWYQKIANHSEITIRQLLSHTSGVPEYVYSQDLWKTMQADSTKVWTVAERMQFIADVPAMMKPNEGWSYADANYIILGAALERVTGEEIYSLVQQHFLNPLQLKETEPSTRQDLQNLTAAYTGNFFGNLFGEKVGRLVHYGMNPQLEWTGGGFVTTAQNLATWIEALYNNQLLSKTSLKEMHSPVNRMTGKVDVSGYGLGLEIFDTRYGKAYGHTGFMPGYTTLTAHLPAQNLSIAFQLNADPYSSKLKQSLSLFALLDEVLPLFVNQVPTHEVELILVRHAEKAKDGTRNPDLTKAGRERAERLKELLKKEGVATIYSTSYKRTMQTAQPLADFLQQEIQGYNAREVTSLFEMMAKNQSEKILIVGHSNTVPAMLTLLDGQAREWIAEQEYDNIYRLKVKGEMVEVIEEKF